MGEVECVVFNVAPPYPPGTSFGNLPKPHEIDPAYLTDSFNIGATGCVRVANHAIPPMLERGRGVFLISGATMAIRGAAGFACMTPVKAALRSYSQSMFQCYAPLGVHVAHVVLDGVIDSPRTHPYGETMQLMDPADIADAYFALAQQPPSVWSYEIQLTSSTTTLGMRL
jgi:NAD(P)-dependent dehydrogenase (short-subunit alcohol dehydrogenase family)